MNNLAQGEITDSTTFLSANCATIKSEIFH